MSSNDSGSEASTSPLLPRLLALGVLTPVTALAVGVDGGAVFQILAIEELELDPRSVGIALGLGTLSIPLQLWAVRIPLERARRNLRLHVVVLGVMSLVTAALVWFAAPGSLVVGLALVIAVLAEISVSVLYATSWQPLISYSLSTVERQTMLGFGRAATGAALLVSVLVFGQLGSGGRTLFLAALGVLSFVLAWSLHVLPHPRTDRDETPEPGDRPSGGGARWAGFGRLFVALTTSALAGWPLLLTWVALVLWPTVNLGVLGAALSIGSIVSSALWRDPGDRLFFVLRAAALGTAVCSVGIALVPRPIESFGPVGALVMALIVVGSASRSVVNIGLMELAHRRVDSRNSVRVMTMFDVIGSTSFQLGFFVAGFLIAASRTDSASLDPYQWWLVATGVVFAIAVARLRPQPAPA
jgi:hypothetical protein